MTGWQAFWFAVGVATLAAVVFTLDDIFGGPE